MAKLGTCEKCYSYGRVTPHHKIFKSEQIALRDCKENIIHLCDSCHYTIHHGKNGQSLKLDLQLDFQNYLERILLKELFTIEEVQDLLEISYKDAYKIIKTLKRVKGNYYTREDIIRSAMGNKIITESECNK